MLVLSRKLNEEIVIAGGIRVKVLELRRGRVRLGVSAPADVSVDRMEVGRTAAAAQQRNGADRCSSGVAIRTA